MINVIWENKSITYYSSFYTEETQTNGTVYLKGFVDTLTPRKNS